MSIPHLVVGMISLGLMVVGTGMVAGQDYPHKPIRIVTSAAGGGSDFAARIIAQGLPAGLGQQVIVDNRTTLTATEAVLKAAPDGYTLLLTGSSFWVQTLLQKAAYDPVKDFSPITFSGSSPLLLVVHPSLAVKSVKELVALAKSRPGDLNYASGGTGTSTHLAAELFKAMAGVNIVRISYKANGPALTGLLSGESPMMFIPPPPVTPHIKSGRLRALALTSARPSELFPGMPTLAATGLPEYEVVSIDAIFAPIKTPDAIINRMRQEIVRVVNRPEVKQKFFDSGIEILGSSPEESEKYIKTEIAKLGKVIKDAGIKAE